MFDKIFGNDKIKAELEDSVKLNKISHSYLFIGTDGIGKKMIAKEFAKMVLCLNENKYCNNCKSCLEFDTNNHPDFNIIEPEENSMKIEQIREFQNSVIEKPIISEKKVYIINDADKMTDEAQNCLLKTLEEPPEFVIIILIASNENAFLPTIESRCVKIHFENLSNSDILKYFELNGLENFSSQSMLDASQGSIGKALKIKDNQDEYSKIEKLIYSLESSDEVDILNMADVIYSAKEKKYDLLDYMNVVFIKMALKSAKYAKCIQIVEETKKRLIANSNYDMCIDNMLFNIYEIANKQNL